MVKPLGTAADLGFCLTTYSRTLVRTSGETVVVVVVLVVVVEDVPEPPVVTVCADAALAIATATAVARMRFMGSPEIGHHARRLTLVRNVGSRPSFRASLAEGALLSRTVNTGQHGHAHPGVGLQPTIYSFRTVTSVYWL